MKSWLRIASIHPFEGPTLESLSFSGSKGDTGSRIRGCKEERASLRRILRVIDEVAHSCRCWLSDFLVLHVRCVGTKVSLCDPVVKHCQHFAMRVEAARAGLGADTCWVPTPSVPVARWAHATNSLGSRNANISATYANILF